MSKAIPVVGWVNFLARGSEKESLQILDLQRLTSQQCSSLC